MRILQSIYKGDESMEHFEGIYKAYERASIA
jgi:hypothetical protein